MGCELPTIKYSIFLFSTISAILGLGNIVFSGIALNNYQDEELDICIAMIVLGLIAFLISFFGCFGTIRENIFFTWTYASFLLILIAANSVIIFNYLTQLDGETEARKVIDAAWLEQLSGKDGMLDIQSSLKCCGRNSATDYTYASLIIPNSCFVGGDYKSTILFSEGCLDKLIPTYEAAEHWVTIFLWSSFISEIFAFISACVLAITFTNQKRRARY